ncbi:zinc finger protein 770 [Astyanax mexicanus]|uniref:zinc finger protein 770 n=1 Tax=Astyanax mexicanus TaxID=7994 RepID=UPI0020CAB114|nr:zinc finger protein 770 [Astyanax mexicanus]
MHDLNSMALQCSVCLKKFDFYSKLRRHQLTHSGQRPFTCSICNKGFRQTAHLKRHLESHAKPRPNWVLGAADSELQYKNTEESSTVPHARAQPSILEQTEMPSASELVNHSVWYNALQTQNESEWKYVEDDCTKEQELVENSMRNSADSFIVTNSLQEQNHTEDYVAKKQTCDTVHWNYSGFAEKENDCQNEQYSECRMLKPEPETSLEKQEQLGLYDSREDLQTDIGISDSSYSGIAQVSLETMEKTPKQHQCATCLKCFNAPSKLRRHVLIHTSERPFGCQLCSKAFRQLAHLKIHLTTHFTQRKNRAKFKPLNVSSGKAPQSRGHQLNSSVKISACSSMPLAGETGEKIPFQETFVTKKSEENCIRGELLPKDSVTVKLNSETLMRGKVMHECPVCFKCFSAPSKLRRHCLIHTGQRPFQCSLCYRSFRQLSHLKVHYSVHTAPRKKRTLPLQLHKAGNQPHSSKTRLRRFVSSLNRKFRSVNHQQKQVSLKENILSSKSASLSCTIGCKTTDANDNVWESDVLKYSENKDCSTSRQGYWCTVCSKSFNAPSKLRRHLLIHTGQRPFKCLVCFKAFTQRSHLKVHRCRRQSKGAGKSTLSEVQLLEKLDKHSPTPNVLEITDDPVNSQQPTTCNNTVTDSTDSFIPSNNILKSSSVYIEDNSQLTSLPNANIPSESMTNSTFEGVTDTTNQTKECGHQCTICLKIFDFPSKLSRHLLIHMDIRPFTCAVCSKSFRQLSHLQSHEKVHTLKRKMMYKGSHKRRIVAPKTAPASETSKTFEASKISLNKKNTSNQDSENIPSLQKPDPDCVLVESNENPESLQMNTFNNVSPPSCSWSAEELSSVKSTTDADCTNLQNEAMPGNVLANNASPLKKRNPNQCTFCLKTFDFPSKLSRHLRIHTGLRPYECHVCHKSFKQLSHLQCHQWVHNRACKKVIVSDNLLTHQEPTSPGWGTMSGKEPHQERPEGFTLVHHGQNAYTDQEPPVIWNPGEYVSAECSSSSSDHKESKVKSEVDPQVDRLKLETGTSVIGADGVSRRLDWYCPDQVELSKTSDLSQSEERPETKNTQDIHYCVPEDCSNRSPTVSDCCRLGFSYEQQEPTVFRGPKNEAAEEDYETNFTEPPNDLPICPACSQCFPTLKKLHAHKCPLQAPEDRLRKSYQCAVCFKSFEAPSKLKRHYLIHTGQRPYQCTMCNKAYTQSAHLKTHMFSHR